METWNSRYVAFAATNGRTPAQQYEHDAAKAAGRNLDFILWVRQGWREWLAANGRREDSRILRADHLAFDAWLASKEVA